MVLLETQACLQQGWLACVHLEREATGLGDPRDSGRAAEQGLACAAALLLSLPWGAREQGWLGLRCLLFPPDSKGWPYFPQPVPASP